jgi:hypothetical protein
MKTVHIVVRQGLIQAVYAERGLDIDIVIHDLDIDNEEAWLEEEAVVAQLPEFTKQIY